jgi:hypothetical protein
MSNTQASKDAKKTTGFWRSLGNWIKAFPFAGIATIIIAFLGLIIAGLTYFYPEHFAKNIVVEGKVVDSSLKKINVQISLSSPSRQEGTLFADGGYRFYVPQRELEKEAVVQIEISSGNSLKKVLEKVYDGISDTIRLDTVVLKGDSGHKEDENDGGDNKHKISHSPQQNSDVSLNAYKPHADLGIIAIDNNSPDYSASSQLKEVLESSTSLNIVLEEIPIEIANAFWKGGKEIYHRNRFHSKSKKILLVKVGYGIDNSDIHAELTSVKASFSYKLVDLQNEQLLEAFSGFEKATQVSRESAKREVVEATIKTISSRIKTKQL